MIEWEQVRNQYPLLGESRAVYLNQGSIGLISDPVVAARRGWEENERKFGPNSPKLNQLFFYGDPDLSWPGISSFRKNLASFIGAKTDEVFFTHGTSDGLRTALYGLSNYDSSYNSTVTTPHEYGSVYRFLEDLEWGRSTEIKTLPFDEDLDATDLYQRCIKGIEQAVNQQTRALLFSDVLRSCGILLPVREMVETAKSINPNILTVVDGAQSFGQMPIDVKAYGCDIYATSGHKWLGGPSESGILYVSDSISPAVGFMIDEFTRMNFTNLPENVSETEGTPTIDLAKLVALNRSLLLTQELGINQINAQNRTLAMIARERLAGIKRLRLFPENTDYVPTGIVSFKLDWFEEDEDVEKASMQLQEAGIIHTWMDFPNLIRACFHVYNNEEDIERLAQAVERLT